MRTYFLLSIGIFVAGSLAAQVREKAVNLIKPQEYFINSYLNLTGQSSLILEVNLPPNTVRWFYTVAASRSKESIRHAKAQFSLFAQLTRIIDKTGTAAKAIDLLTTPPGNDYCNVYLLNSKQDADAFNKEFSIKSYGFHAGCSRENYVSGTVEVAEPAFLSGKQYLGFYNPSPIYGISMVVEVAAVVEEENRSNGWTAAEKEQLYQSNRAGFIEKRMLGQLTEQQARALYDCVIEKITAAFTPQHLATMAGYELEKAVNGFTNECNLALGLISSPEPETADHTAIPVITDEDLTGFWESDGSQFQFYPDGTLRSTTAKDKERTGTWKLANNRVRIKFTDYQFTLNLVELKNRRLICEDEQGKRVVYRKGRN
ncbi:MAG: hypothetical protein KDD12_11535 [Lewinella sp.]|nr:hypothetical protein [Lewinella sp.]